MIAVETIRRTYVGRIECVWTQFKVALRRAAFASPAEVERYEAWVLYRRVSGFRVLALDGYGLCHADLRMTVSWDIHDKEVSIGHTLVATDTRWVDGAAIDVDEAIGMFEKRILRGHMTPKLQVLVDNKAIANPAARRTLMTQLGLVESKPPLWAGPREQRGIIVPELPELFFGNSITEGYL